AGSRRGPHALRARRRDADVEARRPPTTWLSERIFMDPISEALGRHYAAAFDRHGPTSQGVDWGTDAARAGLRYEKMLAVLGRECSGASLLDVGCGYGGLLTYATGKGLKLDYTGIDVAGNMIEWAAANVPAGRFIRGDVLTHDFARTFDYVVCN